MARDFFSQSQTVAMQNQSNSEITFNTELKTSLWPGSPRGSRSSVQLEHPIGVRKIIHWNPVGDSFFFFVPSS